MRRTKRADEGEAARGQRWEILYRDLDANSDGISIDLEESEHVGWIFRSIDHLDHTMQILDSSLHVADRLEARDIMRSRKCIGFCFLFIYLETFQV